MSGICGIVRLDGRRPSSTELDKIVEPLRRRGPDGIGLWVGKKAALGHTLLATTPESTKERLPLNHQQSGCTITADARLDNRADLLAKLGCRDGNRPIGDGELILRAYLKWGEECPKQLLGDFAFAIWDEQEQMLFCARDQMGMRQLIYAHRPGEAFIFASEPGSVIRHPAVPTDRNEARIADFLFGLEDVDLTSTFYRHVHRLPPAHALSVTRDRLRIERYWTLTMPAMLRLSSDAEYAEAFREVLTGAVESRLRSNKPVGAMLSGGMDSTTVAALAGKILSESDKAPLKTYSVARADPATCTETAAIHEAMQIRGIEPTVLRLSDIAEYQDDLLELAKNQAEPFDGQMSLVRMTYLAARRDGVNAMMDGVSADVVLSGTSYIPRLLRRGRVRQALREARGHERFWGPEWPAWKTLGAAAYTAFLPRRLRDLRRNVAGAVRDRWAASPGGAPDFARSPASLARRRKARLRDASIDRFAPDQRAHIVLHPSLTVGRERYDRVASALAIEPRDPFIDLRVIDFCLSLPWEQLQQDGWPKLVLRRAAGGLVPEGVRWRRGREHLGWRVTRELFGDDPLSKVDIHCARQATMPSTSWNSSTPSGLQACGLRSYDESLAAVFLYYWLRLANEQSFSRSECES
jgi:asparagine synthase (glutamine-hydrolysing)